MVKQLNLDQFADWCASANAQQVTALHVTALVIDVREAWELQTAPVAAVGFKLLHIPMQRIPASVDELKQSYGTDHPIAVLCHHGVRSLQVAGFLAHHGFTNLVNLQGGTEAWSRQIDANVCQY